MTSYTQPNIYYIEYTAVSRSCLTNGEKLTRQCCRLLWVMVVFTVARVNLKVFQRGERKQHKHVYSFFSFLVSESP